MNLVCPISGQPLIPCAGELITEDGAHRYPIDDGIIRAFVEDVGDESLAGNDIWSVNVTNEVRDFYENAPFPNYNDFDNIKEFLIRADRSVFARLLRDQIPMNSNILEVGCGTGQLSNYLAATCMARVYATDMSVASLQLGQAFARTNDIHGIKFVHMNLFRPCIASNSMDIVISNGVLHHTFNTKIAFLSIAPLVKSGGHIIVGLYNRIGRLRTDLRRILFHVFGERVLFLDPHLRKKLSSPKRHAWIMDQYDHPQEQKHVMDEVLQWFEEAGFEFVSSIPKIIGEFSQNENIFQRQPPGFRLERVMAEIGMLFSTLGGEGGLFIMVGQKRQA